MKRGSAVLHDRMESAGYEVSRAIEYTENVPKRALRAYALSLAREAARRELVAWVRLGAEQAARTPDNCRDAQGADVAHERALLYGYGSRPIRSKWYDRLAKWVRARTRLCLDLSMSNHRLRRTLCTAARQELDELLVAAVLLLETSSAHSLDVTRAQRLCSRQYGDGVRLNRGGPVRVPVANDSCVRDLSRAGVFRFPPA